ncbi:MAG: carbon storage regulator CsrA [Candidatus Sericytochromatia bacterium]|nr:carbon storage regulator CsrA [Candidatus Sericytochromatia bacterium]
MLVLSRKINQSVMIGDDIEIILLETKGDTAKLGIVAPRDVKVYRQEIYQAIKSENIKATQAPTPAVDAASSLLKDVLKARKRAEP